MACSAVKTVKAKISEDSLNLVVSFYIVFDERALCFSLFFFLTDLERPSYCQDFLLSKHLLDTYYVTSIVPGTGETR